jgi:hypothetical protein
MPRLLLALLVLIGLATPAHAQADDISAASRSVVRVAVAQLEGDQIVDFGHGSGFAVGPRLVLTNAHVVALAVSDPDRVRIGVIPAEGSPPSPARIVSVDPARDLALLELQQGSLPALTLYTGRVPAGAPVGALGYPGNVDRATAQSFEDLLQPRPPSRSMGNFSDMRSSPVGPTMVHTADIARGHSGGPLVDACGRVVGVNVALTNNEMGDSSFGFAIPASSVIAFTRQAGVRIPTNGSSCVSLEDRERAEAQRAEQQRRERETEAEAKAREAEEQRVRAQAAIADERETRLYVALLLLVLSLAAMGAAGVLTVKNLYQPAIAAGVVAAILLISSAVVFLTRPSLADAAVTGEAGGAGGEVSRFVGRNLCRLQPERSRVTVSNAPQVEFNWAATGCVNEATQYARDGDVWQRVLVPNGEQTVTVSAFNTGSGEYVVSRYLLSARAMESARRLRARVEQKACTADEEAKLRMADQQRDLLQALPQRPNERLVYQCEPAGG